ncbi:hypothetical protein N7470_003501 [Penicillium chermesinum]|nr:hypothetical protein N7470_003501 [Penicillium chermesinum]
MPQSGILPADAPSQEGRRAEDVAPHELFPGIDGPDNVAHVVHPVDERAVAHGDVPHHAHHRQVPHIGLEDGVIVGVDVSEKDDVGQPGEDTIHRLGHSCAARIHSVIGALVCEAALQTRDQLLCVLAESLNEGYELVVVWRAGPDDGVAKSNGHSNGRAL